MATARLLVLCVALIARCYNNFGLSCLESTAVAALPPLDSSGSGFDKKTWYLGKVAELAVHHFVSDQHTLTICGLVLAGPGDLKRELQRHRSWDALLASSVVAVEDTPYSGRQGLFHAVTLASPHLHNVALGRQRELVAEFFTHIARDTNMCCFGWQDTVKLLRSGIVSTVLVSQRLQSANVARVTILADGHDEEVMHFSEEELRKKIQAMDEKCEVREIENLVDWVVRETNATQASVEWISDSFPEGCQLYVGFGGFAGILRYPYTEDEDAEA
eukprot:TRINITY_DN5753_c0_g1_i1.p1 TRINITY_DN5753_c0_g1~~TRINITY_DN5753_c0_g1_i1.p1  ORF type:complete len:274 (-),score=40.90 TRINITY_DN5753_c0_g1_i1:62-883(-)